MYEIDKPKFLMENFDGEAVLVNVESGFYYSLLGSGPEILSLLDSGMSIDEVAASIGDESGAPAHVRELVANFTDRLLEESILIPRKSQPSSMPRTRVENDGATVAIAFAPPEITKFEDMRDILLLDPIHQVDEAAGWPKPR